MATNWEIDSIFSIPNNSAVLRFLVEKSPSAHSDLVDELRLAVQGLSDAHLYCPDKANYAYFAVHRSDHTIFALALGIRQIVFRLPNLLIPKAIQDGGQAFPDIAPQWISFLLDTNNEPIDESRRRLGYWCRKALLAGNKEN